MKIVTGVGENAHVTPEEFRMIFEGTFGSNAYILDTGERMEPELVSNNLLKIKSGLMCDDEGNISSVDIYDEVELKNGTQGIKRIDLIVNRYTKNDETKIEKNEWICITGTPDASNPVAPAHITGSLRAGDLVKDIPFIKVHFDGLNITQIETLVSVTKNIKDLTAENESRKNEIAQLNGNFKKHHHSIYFEREMTSGDYFDISVNDFKMEHLATYLITITSQYPGACSGAYVFLNGGEGIADEITYALCATGHSFSFDQSKKVFRITYNFSSGQKVHMAATRIG